LDLFYLLLGFIFSGTRNQWGDVLLSSLILNGRFLHFLANVCAVFEISVRRIEACV
jgi:hypothetical protein